MAKSYTQAPLPFMGQKRRWNEAFKAALRNEFTDCDTFIDLFGGSGLLSHFTHTVFPNAQVIYNDFDHYADRLAHIPDTNALLAELRVILHGYPRYKRITEPYYSRLMQVIERYNHTGFVPAYLTLRLAAQRTTLQHTPPHRFQCRRLSRRAYHYPHRLSTTLRPIRHATT